MKAMIQTTFKMKKCQNSDYGEDSEVEIDNISTHNISNVSTLSSGCSCIRNILDELKKNNNKHNWISETIDSLLEKYFKSKSGLDKLFLYEMDVINSEVHKQKISIQKN